MTAQQTSQAIRTLQIVHLSVTVMPFLFGAVVFIMNQRGYAPQSPELAGTFLYISAGLLLLALPVSSWFFKSYLKRNVKDAGQTSKGMIGAYQTAHLIRISMFEIPGFMAAYSAYLTGDMRILSVTVLSVIQLGSLFPSRIKIEQVNLHAEDHAR